MLAIRLQRTGRKGHAQFRVIVQDSRRSPSSGRVVEVLGNYNPHTKDLQIDKDKAETFLTNGAQPSDRVARILNANKVKLPSWVSIVKKAEKSVKNPEKLRKNQPEAPAEETPAEEVPATDAEAPKTEETTEAPEAEAEAADTSETKE